MRFHEALALLRADAEILADTNMADNRFYQRAHDLLDAVFGLIHSAGQPFVDGSLPDVFWAPPPHRPLKEPGPLSCNSQCPVHDGTFDCCEVGKGRRVDVSYVDEEDGLPVEYHYCSPGHDCAHGNDEEKETA